MNEARQLAMKKLRPVLEPRLKEGGLEFEDVIPALEQVDRIEDLQGALTNPSELIKFLATSVGALLCEHPEMLQRFAVGAVQKALPAGRLADELVAGLRAVPAAELQPLVEKLFAGEDLAEVLAVLAPLARCAA